jgi:DNA-binding transcriptional LysR family regulator
MLDFELLRAFVTVADCGGFHRAAERLNLTQSTVSQQIKRLERGKSCLVGIAV